MTVARAQRALDRLDAALRDHAPALQARAASGCVLDGHGDLRPEHVCLPQPPMVNDCLEFNAALRQFDPFGEIGYLSLECQMAGAPWIAAQLLEGCAAALADRPSPVLLYLHSALRAMLRARLALAHLLDPEPRTPDQWPQRAWRYVERATTVLHALQVEAPGHRRRPPDRQDDSTATRPCFGTWVGRTGPGRGVEHAQRARATEA